jgi:hypothetical protein
MTSDRKALSCDCKLADAGDDWKTVIRGAAFQDMVSNSPTDQQIPALHSGVCGGRCLRSLSLTLLTGIA